MNDETSKPKKLPQEVLEQLKFWSEANDYGFAEIGTKDFNFIMMGSNEYGANQISLMIAYALLHGILSGAWIDLNEEDTKRNEAEQADLLKRKM